MSSDLHRIRARYFRKVIAYPEGKIVHHGDCTVYSTGICICGLHHDLLPLSDGLANKLYPELRDELERANNCWKALVPDDEWKKKYAGYVVREKNSGYFVGPNSEAWRVALREMAQRFTATGALEFIKRQENPDNYIIEDAT